MENKQQQQQQQPVPVIDLCSSSDDDDDELENDDINQITNNDVARRRQLSAAATAKIISGNDDGSKQKNPKRARLAAAAAEARIMQLDWRHHQQQQPPPPPQKQQQRRQNHQHQHHYRVAENSTATTISGRTTSSTTAIARKPPPPAAAAALTNESAECEERELLVFLNAHTRDNAIVTTDIGQLLANLPAKNKSLAPPNVVTCCCRSSTSTTTTSTRPPSIRSRSRRRLLTLHHVQQPDQWSCGFRNLQMLLFALVPQLQRNSNHAYFKFRPENNNGAAASQDNNAGAFIAIPSLPEIEQSLESAWSAGFDEKGQQHYHGKLCGKRAWVGAVEIWSVLTYWSIDACVVQFIRTFASRRQLGPFLYAYFTRQQQYYDNDSDDSITCMFCSQQQQQQEGRCSSIPTTQAMATKLLTIASSSSLSSAPRLQHDDSSCSCSCPVLPVYLQWKGHSVTVIGVEMSSCPNKKSGNAGGVAATTMTAQLEPINLLVLDPSKNGQAIQSSLAQGNLNDNKSKIRLSLHRLASQDVQVILASTRSITEQERMVRKVNINAVTAA